MIKISLDIQIRAKREVVWAYMADIPMAIAHNRLHGDIISLQSPHAKMGHEYIIPHRAFLRMIEMKAMIEKCIPGELIQIRELTMLSPKRGFQHTCMFRLISSKKGTKLAYSLEGTFGNSIQDLLYKPIARGIMMEELFRIKHAIESSEPTLDIKTQSLKPI
ncbi:MAG: hypothetical protein ACE5D7_06005 [Fidelibacterota bacterium]